jgi:hypothetical protein
MVHTLSVLACCSSCGKRWTLTQPLQQERISCGGCNTQLQVSHLLRFRAENPSDADDGPGLIDAVVTSTSEVPGGLKVPTIVLLLLIVIAMAVFFSSLLVPSLSPHLLNAAQVTRGVFFPAGASEGVRFKQSFIVAVPKYDPNEFRFYAERIPEWEAWLTETFKGWTKWEVNGRSRIAGADGTFTDRDRPSFFYQVSLTEESIREFRKTNRDMRVEEIVRMKFNSMFDSTEFYLVPVG